MKVESPDELPINFVQLDRLFTGPKGTGSRDPFFLFSFSLFGRLAQLVRAHGLHP